MIIYRTRYQAWKVKRSRDIVVKVDGGFTAMDVWTYQAWKKESVKWR